MKYLQLLKLDIRHSYYADGRCPDFYIEANKRTQAILQGHRCIFTSTPNGFMLLQAVSNNAPFIELAHSTILGFRIHPASTTYRLFTDFSKFPKQGSAVFTNKEVSSNELRITAAETVRRDQHFADIEIEINDTVKPTKKNPVNYQVNYKAKQAYWEYFFIVGPDEGDPELQLIHAENQAGAHSEKKPIIFTTGEEPRNQMITDRISKEYPGAKIIYFVSKEPVLCQQIPRKNIQLRLNEKCLLDNLPNPLMSNINRYMNGEGDGSTAHDSFFHIVKYITRSL